MTNLSHNLAESAAIYRRIAAYRYPRAVWIVDELPKGPTGKILRREIVVPEGILQ